MPQFKVLHEQVGPFRRDSVVTDADIRRFVTPPGDGTDPAQFHADTIRRMLELKAIELTSEQPTGPVPPGPENRPLSPAETEALRRQAAERKELDKVRQEAEDAKTKALAELRETEETLQARRRVAEEELRKLNEEIAAKRTHLEIEESISAKKAKAEADAASAEPEKDPEDKGKKKGK